MTRRAAGRADGRLSRRTVPRAGGRLGAAVATGLLTALPLVCPPQPAVAAPAGTADGSRPVTITVGRLEPRTVTPGSTITLSGTLVNDSEDTFTDLAVRMQRGELLTTRRALSTDLADPDDATAATAPFLPVPGELDPGDSLTFTYSVTPDELRLATKGVYPALVNVNGVRAGGATERVGELSTYLVAQPAAPTSRTTVAWLWPFTDRPHRDATGAFTDDDLAAEVAPDGRLDRVLSVLEELPVTPGSDQPVPVTVAVDPALLEEVATMAAGPYTVDGARGSGTADAADFLDRLRRVAAVHPVVALPYADVDADALVSVGLAAAVTRTLPGTPEGTARQPVDDDGTTTATPAAPATTTGGSGGTSTGGGRADDDTSVGAALVREVLDVEPRTDVAWPAGGTVRSDTLDVLADGGATTVVLGEAGLTDSDRAVGALRGTVATARAEVSTTEGAITALVADDALGDVVATAATHPGGPRLAEQRYLAELGVLTTQLAADAPASPQSVLVVPPRAVDADPETTAAMIGDTVTQPWLGAASLSDLSAGPATDAGTLSTTDAPAGDALPRDGLTQIAETTAVRDDFAAAVAGDADTALAGYDAAIARAGSAAWRGDPAAFDAATDDLRATVADLRAQVGLLAPADGTYSLASSDAPLVLTVQNDLPFAVQVRLQLRARGNVGFSADDSGVTTLEPLSRTTVRVPTSVQQSGSFAVTAVLTTPAGGPLGEPVQLQVKSTAYGTVTLVITVGAAVLLGLLFLRRLVRFLRGRRGGTPPEEDATTDPLTVPPVRSPV
ncbi:hypothetical protein SAMN05661080_02772 [Modestobacter sp. DSM 44400]|uniref:DUF6049 family protein n=1 Tax=Modestobacter sp. DSM 44400 TaxID=1550230 RepID=UPI0008973ABB|nr:DUF6049 family protein [Modestobacter sp. DSM 44400]SDY23001.1 hypothetical protein SAMN05661080_02772 [Modestobacter sp. DSM 44400]